ncbi:terminase [Pseudomonas fulva]|uniref:terminase n=1 Tax=Pseudomonas fulva TaxID=47880 RepID=UPI0034619A03
MNKRLPNLLSWQWRGYPHSHRHPANLVLHLIAVPLFILGVLLLVSGLFGLDIVQLAIGLLALVAALGLQRHGHRLEADTPEPFINRTDRVQRVLSEQFITFPRFVVSGAWRQAWRDRHKPRR